MTPLAERVAQIVGSQITFEQRLGGDVSGATLMTLANGNKVVAKRGHTARLQAEMLRSIGATGAPVPAVLGEDRGLLVMAYLEHDGNGSWKSLSAALELLHVPAEKPYGWPANFAFGKVGMPNANDGDWPKFWAENRLLCHNRHIGHGLAHRIDKLANRLDGMLPANPPAALLHGDLWGGNLLWNDGELAGLIDPACYYGDREVDFAMLTLFDDPPESFFEAAELEAGWRERQDVYRLWPLLLHVRLFGDTYVAPTADCLDRLGV